MKKYPVVTLCGSTRFKNEFEEAQKKLTLDGNIVISVGLFGHSGDDEVWENMPEDTRTETKHMLDDMHKRKIDMADSIYVVNPEEYIGKSTWSEICYARMIGKRIQSLEYISEMEIESRVGHCIDAADEFAKRSIDVLFHQGMYADMSKHPFFKYKGTKIYDPWISPESHAGSFPWIDHEDPEKRVDPFETYGKKNAAWIIEELLYQYGKNDFY